MSDSVVRPDPTRPALGRSQCIEWYHEGETRIVEAHGVRIEVVGRKGRRARIAIVASPEAAFQAVERSL